MGNQNADTFDKNNLQILDDLTSIENTGYNLANDIIGSKYRQLSTQ